MKYVKNILALSATILFCASCADMLDIYPHSAVAPASITEKDLSALEMGMYLSAQNNPSTESWVINDLLGGDIKTNTAGAFDLISNTLSPLNSIVSGSWNGYFKALYQVNNVISIVDGIESGTDRDRIKGSAHYFRAQIYTNLVTLWGDMPIIRENTLEKVSREPKEKVWEFILEDLDNAIEYLPKSSSSYYYLCKDAAMALKARVQLYVGNKVEAASLAESIISSNKYSLDSFDKIFRKKSNSEVIFSFVNETDESDNGISALFYSYAHSTKGSYLYKPTQEVMDMYSGTDTRKAMSVDASTGNDVLNKYSGGQESKDPVVVSRLGEIYLISAEAQGLAGGLDRLNELRAKRGLAPVSPTTEEKFQDAVLDERRHELFGENFRFFDLVRTGRATKTLGIQEYQQLLPIPSSELRLNNNLKPNPGY